MGITLFDGHQIESLAASLAESLARERIDPFYSPVILVPNMNVETWLKLELAKWQPPGTSPARASAQIAINLDIGYFEAGLWDLLLELDNTAYDAATTRRRTPLRLTREVLQWMIMSILMAEPAPSPLDLLLRYAGEDRDPKNRQYARKIWQVSDRLARLFREYEFNRPETIRQWMESKKPHSKQSFEPTLFEGESRMYKCQRELYRRLFAPNGLRDKLALSSENKNAYFSLPQMFSQVLDQSALKWDALQARGTLRIFIAPQLTAFYTELLQQLGTRLNVEIYHLKTYHNASSSCALREQWGKAGEVKANWLRELKFKRGEMRAPAVEPAATVLAETQYAILGLQSDGIQGQDRSLQIAACPSVRREVETVCNSIVHKMVSEPELKLTDVAILVPEMAAYKPILESVLNRQPRMLSYNLIDATAADDSVFAQAVTAFLKLAEGDFVRREVFELLMNPCFLAAHGMQRNDAIVWLNWADKLNIFRKFSVPSGSLATPFSWQQGLRRLRLGRLMETGDSAGAPMLQDYEKVVPFADMESESAQEVGRFSLAIEQLSETTHKLATKAHSVEEWHRCLSKIFGTLLQIPHDRIEEYLVQSTLLQALGEFKLFDKLIALAFEATKQEAPGARVGLPLIQEFVRDNLASVPSRVGHYLLDGVTISALKADRPLPFKVIYILGLGEGQYPGSDPESALDIRTEEPARNGETSPSDTARQCFLETALSARSQLYLSYVSKNLQKDEQLQPCSLVNELRTYIEEHILHGTGFSIAEVPLKAASESFLLDSHAPEKTNTAWCDLLDRNYWAADNLAALAELMSTMKDRPDLHQSVRKALKPYDKRVKQALAKKELRRHASQPDGSAAAGVEIPITLDELEKFLLNPANASFRRHLKLFDESEDDVALVEDEPFSSSHPFDYNLLNNVFQRLVRESGGIADKHKLEKAALEILRASYEQSALCGDVPPGAFGELDRAQFSKIAQGILSGEAGKLPGLEHFLGGRVNLKDFDSVVIGEKNSQEKNAIVFPPVSLKCGEYRIALHGDFQCIYESEDEVQSRRELLVLAPKSKASISGKKIKTGKLSKHAIRPFLFYLSMLAGTEKNTAGITSANWWGKQALRLVVAYKDGLLAWDYDRFTSEDARAYLEMLAHEYISEQNFDLLPFEVVNAMKTRPFEGGEEVPDSSQYQRELRENIAKDEDGGDFAHGYRPPAYFDLLQLEVPQDALKKVMSRYTPLFKAEFQAGNLPAGDNGDD